MRVSSSILAIFSIIATTPGAQATESEGPIIGYGSSDAVLPAKTQELFYAGFELGLKDHLKRKMPANFLAVNQISDGNKLSAIRSAKNLVAQGAKMIVGFPSSHEALLAGEVAQKEGMLAIFAGAGHSKLATMGRTVFTTGETMEASIESVLNLALEKFKNKKGLVIVNPNAVFSTNQIPVINEFLKQPRYSELILKTASVDKYGKLSPEQLNSIKENPPDYYLFTPYTDECTSSLDQLVQIGSDKPILSNSSWTSADIDFLRRLVAKHKSPIYSFSLWVKGSPISQVFESRVKKAYGREATGEIAFGYDLGIMVATLLNRVKGTPTKESLIEAFHQNRCFESVTTNRVCFKPTGGHSDKHIIPVQLTLYGISPLKNR